MDKAKFFDAIHRLEATYRIAPCSDETLDVYWQQLKGFSDEWLEEVVDKIIKTEKFFPTPASFLQYRGIERKACPDCGRKDWTSWVDDRCGKCYWKEYRKGGKAGGHGDR